AAGTGGVVGGMGGAAAGTGGASAAGGAGGSVGSSPCSKDGRPNYLAKQPAPSDWGDTFGGVAHSGMTQVVTPCGPGIKWVQSAVAPGNWLLLYPNNASFDAGLVQDHSYTARITMTGSGSYFLNMWDGKLDHASATTTLSATPQTLAVSFKMSTGTPEFQV